MSSSRVEGAQRTVAGPSERVVALAGLPALLAVAVGGMLTDLGGTGAHPGRSPESLLATYRDHADAMLTGAAALLAGATFLLVFVAALSARLRRGSRTDWPATLALGGGVLACALLVVQAMMALAGNVAATVAADGTVARLLLSLGWESYRVFVPSAIAVVGATAWAGLGRRVLPRAFSLASAALALVFVVALAPVFPAGLVSLVFFAWVAVAAVVLAASDGAAVSEDLAAG